MLEGAQVAVVSDGTAVAGNDRQLHWDVAVLPPERDLVSELRRADKPRQSQVMQRKLTHELSRVLEERNKNSPEKQHLPTSQEAVEEPKSPSTSRCEVPAADKEAHGGMYSGVLLSARDRESRRGVPRAKLASTPQDTAPAAQNGDAKPEQKVLPPADSVHRVVDGSGATATAEASSATAEQPDAKEAEVQVEEAQSATAAVVTEKQATSAAVAELAAQEVEKEEVLIRTEEHTEGVGEEAQAATAEMVAADKLEEKEVLPAAEAPKAEEGQTTFATSMEVGVKDEEQVQPALASPPAAPTEDQLAGNKDETAGGGGSRRPSGIKAMVQKDTSCFAWFGKVASS
mmetsp:Transcript_35816/g.65720  ORF Transcript_35816/g.65720 Transcript_35816/m.65720 type:complete len:344 (-) Transcript_35816:111-1142(-)